MRFRIFAFTVLCCALLVGSHGNAQTTIWSDDFEAGTSQWNLTGLWHWIRHTNSCAGPALPFPSGTHCMWYGIDGQCNFDNGLTNTGSIRTINPVALPNDGRALVLRYRNWRQAEACGCFMVDSWDDTSVFLSTNNGQSWTLVRSECRPAVFPWRKGRVDLTPYTGMNVWIRFTLDTTDNLGNGTLGWLVDDVAIVAEVGQSYCETAGCPCMPSGCAPPYNVGGCKHSGSTTSGAELRGSGTAHVSNDDVVLIVEDVPATATVTFFQGGTSPSGGFFGDGLSCVGGSLLRIATKSASNGSASYPEGSEPAISVVGMIAPGGMLRGYQAYYRDSARFCTSATFNLSNGYRIQWTP